MSIEKPCVWCGTVFEAVDNRTKFCSDECRRLRVNKKNREYMRKRAMVEKQCAYCGKNFSTKEEIIRFCSKSCAALNRTEKQTDRPMVKIKITKPIDVFPWMHPEVGNVYEAEKAETSKFLPAPLYIIASIGKHGLIIRAAECVEVV